MLFGDSVLGSLRPPEGSRSTIDSKLITGRENPTTQIPCHSAANGKREPKHNMG
jgi:hypothetical protein